MSQTCTTCEGTGFLNIHQFTEITGKDFFDISDDDPHNFILERWIELEDSDVAICNCCGNGEYWYGIPGEHYNNEDPPGHSGPYVYNGGLCECN